VATLRDIRNRIKSVKNTSQITRAMKMVSAAKLRRSQERAVAGREYHRAVSDLTRSMAAVNPGGHPLFRSRPERRVDLVLFTSDKGLCGSFNANLLKRASNFVEERPGVAVTVIAVGKKGRDFCHRRGLPLAGEFIDISRSIGLSLAREVAALALRRLQSGEADATYVVYSRFVSVITQKPEERRLFPVASDDPGQEPAADYLYEPGRDDLVRRLVPLYADIALFQAMAETSASEYGARMSAMDTATKNAGELIARLTLYYNRARQAAITKELIEVVSGADALEG
jgi:F-type H+-transporting ATPase subunit gamma